MINRRLLFYCCALVVLLVDRSSARQPNVLVISLDTLRADSLGSYGYRYDTSPFLDELAAQGVRFHNAFVNCHPTPPSHTTARGWAKTYHRSLSTSKQCSSAPFVSVTLPVYWNHIAHSTTASAPLHKFRQHWETQTHMMISFVTKM